MTPFVEWTIKVSLVVGLGLLTAALCRRQSAAGRHWILSTTLVAALAVPVMGAVLPGWALVARSPNLERAGESGAASSEAKNVGVGGVREQAAPARARDVNTRSTSSITPTLQLAWAIGVALSLLTLVIGVVRLMWLASRARPVSHATWTHALREIVDRHGVHRTVRILCCEHPSLLITWGVVRPVIIVPRIALDWPEERVHVVLSHELAHIRRGDWGIQIAGELLRAVYWFNPLIWIACRQVRQQSEEACDDEVMAGGIEGSDYAAHLLDAARALKGRAAPWLPAPAIVRPSSLERRIRVMLNAQLRRTPTTRLFRFAAAASMVAATVMIGTAQVTPAIVSGSIVDSTGAPVPGAAVQLTSKTSGATFTVTTDPGGQFQFVPLPSDDYVLSSRLMGFKEVEDTVKLAGKPVRHDLTLAVGQLRETVNVVGGPSEGVAGGVGGGVPGGVSGGVAGGVDDHVQRLLQACRPSSVGGNLRAPRKLKDVRPVYPQSAQAAGIEGTVTLAATIGTDGRVGTVDVVKSAHPDLDAAAVDAVRQWLFDPTLLNCSPTEVSMSVSLNFKATK
jgi:TonB family protein